MGKNGRIGRTGLAVSLIVAICVVAAPVGAANAGPPVKVRCEVGASTSARWQRHLGANYVEVFWYDGEYGSGTPIGQATGTVQDNTFSAPTPTGASTATRAFVGLYVRHELGQDLVAWEARDCVT